MTRIAIAMSLLMLSALTGCGATNTGNPIEPNNPIETPDGIELVRSSLEREQAPALDATEREQVGQDSRDFALELYGQAAADPSSNVFISPYSVSVALAMTYAGAEAETKTEMASALHFGLPEPQLHAAWNAVDQELEGRSDELIGNMGSDPREPKSTGDGLKLEVTNAVFEQRGFEPKKKFLDTLATNYGAGVYQADFAKDPEAARIAINDWAAESTHDRIQDLLPKNSVDSALMVLLNAIYFKASWLTPFDAAMTEPGTFHAPSGDVTVDMMHSDGGPYAEGDGYQALALPYISPSVEMFFILPEAGRFEEIEAGLDRAFFDRVHGELSAEGYEVKLSLPRFTLKGSSLSLGKALQSLGMRRAFGVDGDADLSGIAGNPGELVISDVIHQAFIALDETGTEAAAATAVIAVGVSQPPPKTPVEFTVDRPCLFAIYDNPTGQILFIGRLLDPS